MRLRREKALVRVDAWGKKVGEVRKGNDALLRALPLESR